MSVLTRPAAPPRVRMDAHRRTALVAGICYLLTFVSIPTLFLYGPVRTDPGFLLGAGSDTPVVVGAILETIVAFAGIGTAVALFPVIKRVNEGAALGFAANRVVEAATILGGVVALMTMVGLRRAGVGPDALVTGRALVASYDWTVTLGQSLPPVVSAVLLGSMLYRSRLVPRVLPLLGLVAAPILLATDVAVLFGAVNRVSAAAGLGAALIALWEFSLGVYLVVRGFRPGPLAALADAPAPAHRL